VALTRKELLAGGAAAAAGAVVAGCGERDTDGRETTAARRATTPTAAPPEDLSTWAGVRRELPLDPHLRHFAAFLLSAHPRRVREAIELHRRGLDADPEGYLRGAGARVDVTGAAARYLGARGSDIAITTSTTMGLAILYRALSLGPRDEVLSTVHDFFSTDEALRLSGARVRRVALYDKDDPARASADEIATRLRAAIRPRTRAVALTWVHSSTGVKLPIRRIADALRLLNRGRSESDRILLCVDGVHGFGIENVRVPALGCDFFAAGCHKWLFGPRGTGLVWGRPSAWRHMTHTIPSFTESGTPGSAMTPGGFHSFEHRWALAQAFRFHERIGKARIAARTHALNRQLKAGLARMRHVVTHTPRSDALSAGLVCFEVRGMAPTRVVDRLHARGIIATVTPYTPSYARLAPSILNTPAEIERTLRALRALA
jgi:isopenicillin-N epimerase